MTAPHFPQSTADTVLVIPAYNSAALIARTLETVLAQSEDDFCLIVLDDGSADDTASVVDAVLAARPKADVHLFRNLRNAGLAATWQRGYLLARRLCPGMRYFAWVGDHDLLEPGWLARLRGELRANPEAVLVYPRIVHADLEGRPTGKPKQKFCLDTRNDGRRLARFRRVNRTLKGAGDMVYGLMRADALASAGVFRRTIFPDRLLMLELALAGRFLYVDEILRLRRVTAKTTVARQKVTLGLVNGAKLLGALPWPLVHAGVFAVVRRAPVAAGIALYYQGRFAAAKAWRQRPRRR